MLGLKSYSEVISGCQSVTSGVQQVSISGQVFFNGFTSDLGTGVKCIISKSGDDTKLGGAVDFLKIKGVNVWRAALHKRVLI